MPFPLPFRHPDPPAVPPRYRPPFRRRVGLTLLRLHRLRLGLAGRMTVFSGWVWVAAASVVGFEVFDVVFGAFVLAPELLPVALIVLATLWWLRERSHPVRVWIRVRVRLVRRSVRRS